MEIMLEYFKNTKKRTELFWHCSVRGLAIVFFSETDDGVTDAETLP